MELDGWMDGWKEGGRERILLAEVEWRGEEEGVGQGNLFSFFFLMRGSIGGSGAPHPQ